MVPLIGFESGLPFSKQIEYCSVYCAVYTGYRNMTFMYVQNQTYSGNFCCMKRTIPWLDDNIVGCTYDFMLTLLQ